MAESGRPSVRTQKVVETLLIGGESEHADAIEAMLARSVTMSFSVTRGDRLATALDHPDAKSAELLLLDVSRAADGLDLLTQTRLRLPRLPIVVIGNTDDEDFATRVLRGGALGYLRSAELGTRLLVTTVASALESHRTRLQLNTTRERARHLGGHDPFSGLPNRTLLGERLPQASIGVVHQTALETGLRAAAEGGELVLHYQPQFDVRRKRMIGSEALVRWNHPEFGLLSPKQFMPIAEETGLVVELGEWVLRNACIQNARWQELGHPGLRLSVNVASQQFIEPGFVETVAGCLENTGLAPETLELEITESSLLEDVEATVTALRELKRIGIQLAIDDFGTGYSALAYLKRLPIDVLKIDQSFVQSLATDPADATIVQAIIQIAKGLQLTTIAEGVECQEQLMLLGSYGCERMQGFLFGRPVPAETFERWLEHPPFRWSREDGSVER